jgi:UDP-N-acetylmuramate--alanine ligase
MPTTGLAGTHGKTTSTALMVSVMRAMGGDPTFLVGGRMIGLNAGSHLGSDDRFVLEADEAFGTFRHLDLDSILVTNIEADHLDHYTTLAALEDAFAQVVSRVSGPRAACIDDPGVRRLARRTEVTTYGFDESAEWRVSNLEHRDGGVAFTLIHGDASYAVALPKPGAHLALNAAGVLVVLDGLGYDVALAADALSGFEGVRRRYEIRAHVAGVTIVDDYAHHPTEVGATIDAARHGTESNVVVVFQPHRYTRTADLAAHFGEPLALADTVIVTDVYAAGETPIIGVSGRIVAEAAEAAGADVSYIPRLRDVPSHIANVVGPGDTVLLLGAGDVNSIVRGITAAIRAR